jgi:hypothetical protein
MGDAGGSDYRRIVTIRAGQERPRFPSDLDVAKRRVDPPQGGRCSQPRGFKAQRCKNPFSDQFVPGFCR